MQVLFANSGVGLIHDDNREFVAPKCSTNNNKT